MKIMGLGVPELSILIVLPLIVCAIVAYFLSIAYLVKSARAKNAPQSSGALWFIGLFGSPVMLGLIVASIPDRGNQEGGHFADANAYQYYNSADAQQNAQYTTPAY